MDLRNKMRFQDSNQLIQWTSKTLQLKKKELKWKLMEASQIQNRARLDEIKHEADKTRQKMIKFGITAEKLRAKYLKATRAARAAEALYRKLHDELSNQEKFVADERMALTKLVVECRNIGKQLYGSEYQLESRLTPNKHKQVPSRLSSLYDLKDSILKNLASYRLTTKYSDSQMTITDLNYAHSIRPNDYICLPDLLSTCADKKCSYQHQSDYLMSDIEKLVDILSYKPSLTGYKPDPSLSEVENDKKCRQLLKQYGAKLLAKNSDKSVENIAQNLVKYIRANKLDHELIVMSRELPKVNKLIINYDDTSAPTDEVRIRIDQDDDDDDMVLASDASN